MLSSSFDLSYPLVDHCCGVCVVTKAAGKATWCISSKDCTGDCNCGNYTADCHFPEDETGMNDSELDIFYTLLCTPCSDQFTTIAPCETLCSGMCTVEKRQLSPGSCYYCIIDTTCNFAGGAPPFSTCDCRIDCSFVNCEGPPIGTRTITFCEEKSGPTADICTECT